MTDTALPQDPHPVNRGVFPKPSYLGWKVTVVTNFSKADLWFSDGKPITDVRGGPGLSSRLIVDNQGFLDLTDLVLPHSTTINLNGQNIYAPSDALWITIELGLPGDGKFTATAKGATIKGSLKPLPIVSAVDASFINRMIEEKYVPYQDVEKGLGKSEEEIRKLGKQLFPFTPHSFQLAMCVYDWTTASFVRMVLTKVFEYTSIPETPFPLNKSEVAKMIWESDWGSANPHDRAYMYSLMMTPAHSVDDVKQQLEKVESRLRKLSDVQNHLLAAAIVAMPRVSLSSKPRLFSGQVDVHQFGLDRFGVELLECPLNKGPVADSMTIDFKTVLSTYVSQGHTITTKMVWSFTDTVQDAIHYSNGILLVANPPDDAWVWDIPAHVTPLSDNHNKPEYTFPPGTRFKILSVEQGRVPKGDIVVINLQPLTPAPVWQQHTTPRDLGLTNLPLGPMSLREFEAQAAVYSPFLEKQALANFKGSKESLSQLDTLIPHKTGGRRCRCVDALKASVA